MRRYIQKIISNSGFPGFHGKTVISFRIIITGSWEENWETGGFLISVHDSIIMISENFEYGKTQYHYLVTSGDLRSATDFVLKLDLNVAPSYCLFDMALEWLNKTVCGAE